MPTSLPWLFLATLALQSRGFLTLSIPGRGGNFNYIPTPEQALFALDKVRCCAENKVFPLNEPF